MTSLDILMEQKRGTSPTLNKPRPRVVTVQTNGPFLAFVMFTLFDGRTVVVPTTPDVVNSTDAERKTNKREQGRLATRRCRARKKQRNPVTKRIDPVEVFKPVLPTSIYRDLDKAIMEKLNRRDPDAKPITSVAQAMNLVIEDIVKAEAKAKKGK